MTINLIESKDDYYTNIFSQIISKLLIFANLILAIVKKIINHLIYKFNESAIRVGNSSVNSKNKSISNKEQANVPVNNREQDNVPVNREQEQFRNYNMNNNNTITLNENYNMYKPNDFLASNSNDYSELAIKSVYPSKILLPNNYTVSTNTFEKQNDEYDYKDFNNLDGSGVHLNRNWKKLSGINTPWFETCLSNMNCKIVKGTLEKFNYQN